MTERGARALSEFLRGAVSRGDVPGLVALVVNRDGAQYHEAFGKQDTAGDVAMARSSVFRIASMTKPLTSVAVLMLAEEGKLGLDDRVDKYLPAFANPLVFTRVDEAAGTYQARPAARPITIRHLLTHTSGIGYAWSDPRLALVQGKTRRLEIELPLLHDPGERWTYGAGTRVLGDLVAKISGQRLDEVLRLRLFVPLGMRDTFYAVPDETRARVATVHQRAGGVLTEEPNPAPLPASVVRGDSGLYSTAQDYGLFLRMLLNHGELSGHRYLTNDSMQSLTRNQIGPLVVERQPAVSATTARPYPLGFGADGWSLGFQIAAPGSEAEAGKRRSAGSYSWAGIYNTHFWVDPQKQIAAILLLQVLPFYDQRCIELLSGFEEQVYAQLD